MAGVTYYFDGYDAAQGWEIHPEWMVDNLLGTFAATAVDNEIELLNSNTCPGTDLGTISKVEIRCFASGDVDDRIDLTPVFAAGDGDEHQTTPGITPEEWCSYVDITNDTNAPSPWTWAAVQALDLKVEYDKVAKGNQMSCAKVEIRVTPVGPPEKVTQYLAGLDLPEFPHEMDLISDKLPCPPPY